MVLAWKAYRTDIGRVYPLLSVSSTQINQVSTIYSVEDLLPSSYFQNTVEVSNVCQVSELIARNIVLSDIEGAMFRVNSSSPFTMALHDFLMANTRVAAFQFIGEQIKEGRLRRLLGNV